MAPCAHRLYPLLPHVLARSHPKVNGLRSVPAGLPSRGQWYRSIILQFKTPPCVREMEITGHPVAHLAISVESAQSSPPSNLDLDIFVTLRHFSAVGEEVHCTGSSGDSVPVTKGWLRVSLCKVNHDSSYHRDYLPRREYRSSDVLPYECDVELWPTNVVVEAGRSLVFEVAPVDTEGAGLFKHNSPVDWYVSLFSQEFRLTSVN